MPRGMIIKAISGFFYVQSQDGERIECRGRGRFKQRDTELLVGDIVHYQVNADGRGVVEEVLERRNRLERPPIANIDQVVMIFALASPPLHREMLDRLLILAEREQVNSVVVLNKCDLADPNDAQSIADEYRAIGYPVVLTSVTAGIGIKELANQVTDKLSVVAGPSGAGKSSLLNSIQPGFQLNTSHVSHKIGRGRHTTRHVELLSLQTGGMIADTPGFYELRLEGIAVRELAWHFREMRGELGQCRFGASCLHDREPDCKIKELVEKGELSAVRYARYLEFLAEVKEAERRY